MSTAEFWRASCMVFLDGTHLCTGQQLPAQLRDCRQGRSTKGCFCGRITLTGMAGLAIRFNLCGPKEQTKASGFGVYYAMISAGDEVIRSVIATPIQWTLIVALHSLIRAYDLLSEIEPNPTATSNTNFLIRTVYCPGASAAQRQMRVPGCMHALLRTP